MVCINLEARGWSIILVWLRLILTVIPVLERSTRSTRLRLIKEIY